MAVRSFVVVDKDGNVMESSDFSRYLYAQLANDDDLHLQAIEQYDELANKRGNTPRTFVFAVEEIYRGLNALNVRDTETGAWIQVHVSDRVRFELIS